jgi:hypothetical protein
LISDIRYGPLKEWEYGVEEAGLSEHQRPGQPITGEILYNRGKMSGIVFCVLGGRYTGLPAIVCG